MKSFFSLLSSVLFTLFVFFSPLSFSQESTQTDSTDETVNAFISDDLFIFMRSGAGKQYRLLGSINAGTPISLVGTAKNEYQEIIDDKGRTGWVDEKFIQKTPSLRSAIAELNAQLASKDESTSFIENELTDTKQQLVSLTENNTKLTKELAQITKQLKSSQEKLQEQETGVKKQWFFNGAIVLGIGLILGLLLPRLAVRRRGSMDSWQ